MECDDNTRFRITGYPGSPVALGEIELDTVRSNWQFGPAGSIWLDDGAHRPPLFGESYLELASIDLRSRDEVEAFIARWGILGVRWYQDPRTYERVESPDYRHLFGALAQGPGAPLALKDMDDLSLSPDYFEEAQASAAVIEDLRDSVREAEDFDRNTYKVVHPAEEIPETITEFVFGASLIRDMVRVFRWQSGDPEPDDWESPLMLDSDRASVGAATFWLKAWATPMLGPFHPQFQVLEDYGDGVGAMPPYYHEVPLLNVMALELYNHACENAHYKTCANETCGRLFVRQTGRALHGQHRTTGVKYCSAECAKAQSQRQYRRRQKGAA